LEERQVDNKKRSSQKRHRQSLKRRTANKGTKTKIRTSVRKFGDAVEAKDPAAAKDRFKESESVLDAAASKGVIHKNAAARRKSRLAKKLAAASKS
jgi:small subunit ribosomal protein S20